MNNNIYIFTGHYGSGKTEVALNFAVKNAEEGKKTVIVDLDIVNPYFRTKDAEQILAAYGIKVIAPVYANTNLDIPALPGEIFSVFELEDTVCIFDVGGDVDGAYALGQYKRFFDECEYRMYFVANMKRPLTSDTQELSEMFDLIQQASRLKFTDIANNTNLSSLTDENTLMYKYEEIQKLSELKNVPVSMNCGTEKALSNITENRFLMRLFLKKPWETDNTLIRKLQ